MKVIDNEIEVILKYTVEGIRKVYENYSRKTKRRKNNYKSLDFSVALVCGITSIFSGWRKKSDYERKKDC